MSWNNDLDGFTDRAEAEQIASQCKVRTKLRIEKQFGDVWLIFSGRDILVPSDQMKRGDEVSNKKAPAGFVWVWEGE